MKKKIAYNEYRPHFKFFKVDGRFPSNLYLGHELEVQCRILAGISPIERLKPIEKIINRYPWLYAKDEDTVDGCEINTHPFNWNWWLKNHGIQYVNEIRGTGFYVDRACGFHIHLSKAWFSRQHRIRMAKLFYANPKFIEHVSQRKKARSGKDWTLFKNAANPWLLDEMKRCSTGKDLEFLSGRDFNDPKLCGKLVDNVYEERHVALNFCNKDTIEIRIFQGTLNPKLIQAYLEFCLAAALYTKGVRFQDVSVPGLKQYVRLNSTRFPHLHRSQLMSDCLYRWQS